ncbi:MAG: DUF555 domain-containing protein, partial [Halobacteriales archaeon]
IAISKTGEMLNPDLSYVEIHVSDRPCPHCGEPQDPAFVAADEGLVALELEMVVFNVEREEHASRIARKEIGQRLADIPLSVLEVEVVDEEPDEDEGVEPEAAEVPGVESEPSGDDPDDDELLPDFEELIE